MIIKYFKIDENFFLFALLLCALFSFIGLFIVYLWKIIPGSKAFIFLNKKKESEERFRRLMELDYDGLLTKEQKLIRDLAEGKNIDSNNKKPINQKKSINWNKIIDKGYYLLLLLILIIFIIALLL